MQLNKSGDLCTDLDLKFLDALAAQFADGESLDYGVDQLIPDNDWFPGASQRGQPPAAAEASVVPTATDSSGSPAFRGADPSSQAAVGSGFAATAEAMFGAPLQGPQQARSHCWTFAPTEARFQHSCHILVDENTWGCKRWHQPAARCSAGP